MSDPNVLQLQNYIKAVKPLGLGYSLPADGIVTTEFIALLNHLQALLSNKKLNLVNGKTVNPNALAQLVKAVGKELPKVKETKLEKEDVVSSDKPEESKNEDIVNKNSAWESFLSENLPVVGKLYSGDLSKAAKNLEAAIGKEIDKPMSGVIWNESKKSFNTTPDDIRNALNKIQKHKETPSFKKAKFTQDERVIKFAKTFQ